MTIRIKRRRHPLVLLVIMAIAIPAFAMLAVFWWPGWMLAVAISVVYHAIKK